MAVGTAVGRQGYCEMGRLAVGREDGVNRSEGALIVWVGHYAYLQVCGIVVAVEPGVEADHKVGEVTVPVEVGQDSRAVLSAVLQGAVAVQVQSTGRRWNIVAVLPQAGTTVEHRGAAPVGEVDVVVAGYPVEILAERNGVVALLCIDAHARRIADDVAAQAVYGKLV